MRHTTNGTRGSFSIQQPSCAIKRSVPCFKHSHEGMGNISTRWQGSKEPLNRGQASSLVIDLHEEQLPVCGPNTLALNQDCTPRQSLSRPLSDTHGTKSIQWQASTRLQYSRSNNHRTVEQKSSEGETRSKGKNGRDHFHPSLPKLREKPASSLPIRLVKKAEINSLQDRGKHPWAGGGGPDTIHVVQQLTRYRTVGKPAMPNPEWSKSLCG